MSEELDSPSMPPEGRGPAPTEVEDASPQNQRPRGGRGRGRSAYATRDLTTGSIPRTLWFLAWPATVNGSLRMVDQLADLVWAGFFGSVAIAGLGVAQQWSGMALTARMGMDMGMRAMVSRAMGTGDTRLAEHVVFQAATIALVFGGLMVLAGVFLTEFLLGLLGVSDAVIAEGAMYMRIHLMGQGVMSFQMLGNHALSAAGDTLTPMRAIAVGRITHLIVSPVLMFGLVGMPQMGLAGAAVGTVVAHAVPVAILLSILFRGSSRLHLRLSDTGSTGRW